MDFYGRFVFPKTLDWLRERHFPSIKLVSLGRKGLRNVCVGYGTEQTSVLISRFSDKNQLNRRKFTRLNLRGASGFCEFPLFGFNQSLVKVQIFLSSQASQFTRQQVIPGITVFHFHGLTHKAQFFNMIK